MELGAIVLAGGKARRLGRNKAAEDIGGQSLIVRVIRQLEQLCSRILVVTSDGKAGLPVDCRVETVTDIKPDDGPLGGIYTGLLNSACFYNIVVACDMPFLNKDLLGYMVGLSTGFDAVVPRLNREYIEPLHAVYSKDCLDAIKARLDGGLMRVDLFLADVRVRYIEVEESGRFDPRHLSFFNVNNQADLDRAITLAAEQGN